MQGNVKESANCCTIWGLMQKRQPIPIPPMFHIPVVVCCNLQEIFSARKVAGFSAQGRGLPWPGVKTCLVKRS